MITCATTKPPNIPTTSMRIEIPAAAPLDTPFVLTSLLSPGTGLPVGFSVGLGGAGGGVAGTRPSLNEDFSAGMASVKT